MKPTSPPSPALVRYARRALGEAATDGTAVATLPRTDIVHLHAEVAQQADRLRKIAPDDGGRKA